MTPTVRMATFAECKTRPMSTAARPSARLGRGVGPPESRRPVSAGLNERMGFDWRAALLGALGLVVLFAAPIHRIDLLGIGVVLATLGAVWDPRAGALLIGASLPFFFFGRTLLGPLAVTPPGLMLILTWLGALVQALRRRLILRWPRTPFDGALALFLVAALLSLLVTEYPLLSARELRALIFEPVLFFWLLFAMRGSARLCLGGFLAAAVFTAVVACVQIVLGTGGTEAEGVRRAQAWYPSPNHLALMLGRAWPFLIAAAMLRWRALWLPAAVVGAGIVLTFSTGGWLGVGAATVVVVAVSSRRALALRFGAAAAAALLVVSVLAMAGVLPERLNPLRQTGGFRLDLWLSSLQMIRDHVVFGLGLDNFVYVYQQNYLREGAAAEPNLSHPHNWLLHFWVELGVLGVLAFAWLQVRFWRFARWTGASWITAGALGAMTDLLVHGFIDNSYFLVDLAFVFWLTLALVAQEHPHGAAASDAHAQERLARAGRISPT
jgi:putative inorganic carbon (hco3(-)) transporter